LDLDEEFLVTAEVISVSGLKVGFILCGCSDLRGREIKESKGL
jgi:hypothetical protein